MSSVDLIRIIGWSHLLQPPLTLLLATSSGVDLRRSLIPVTELAREVLRNMAFASIALPTALGVWMACYPAEVVHAGGARTVAGLLATFWCWRLYRQFVVLRVIWPRSKRMSALLEPILTTIFLVQGPGLAWLLCR